jgi:hypothetical protein
VKLLRVENDRYFFELAEREKDLLGMILQLYPVIPSAHHQIKNSSPKQDPASQVLLNETLAEQRKENKKFVENLFADPARFRPAGDFLEMRLTSGEIEWLLQVLNDVHVGNWILLGSPEERPVFTPHAENAAHVWAMHVACLFQVELLEAINPSS